MITIYTTANCAPCITLKAYLDRKGIQYRTKDADNKHNADELIRLTGTRLLPTTIINGKPIQGLNWRAIHDALEAL